MWTRMIFIFEIEVIQISLHVKEREILNQYLDLSLTGEAL